MKNLFKESHKMAKEIKKEYPEVDYKLQFGICLSFLQKEKGDSKVKEVRFSKKGFEFIFRNFEWAGNELIAEYKITGLNENSRNEGFYYNAKYYEKRNAFLVDNVKINGKKVTGVSLPENVDIKSIIEESKKIANNKALEEQKEIDSMFTTDKELNIIHNTSYGFNLGEYGKSTRGKEIEKILEDKQIANEVSGELKKYKTDFDYGDYTISSTYTINMVQFENIVKKIKQDIEADRKAKKKAEEIRLSNIFAKAKETGEKQIINKHCVPCNDPNEECDIDVIVTYAMPDGTTETTRNHTW